MCFTERFASIFTPPAANEFIQTWEVNLSQSNQSSGGDSVALSSDWVSHGYMTQFQPVEPEGHLLEGFQEMGPSLMKRHRRENCLFKKIS